MMETQKQALWQDDGSAARLAGAIHKDGIYQLVWSDDFSGDALDLDKWTGHANMSAPDIVLSMEEDTVKVKDGILTLTTSILDRENPYARYKSNFALSTRNTMNYKWGYLTMRAKVPFFGKGEWPSFWMHSNGSELAKAAREARGVWHDPKYFLEIDIFEQFSSVDTIFPNIHKHDYKDNVHQQLSGIDQGGNLFQSGTRAYKFPSQEEAQKWHDYGFLWTEHLMAYSVDGVFYYAYDLSRDFTQKPEIVGMEDFDQCLHILINNMMYSEGMRDAHPQNGFFNRCPTPGAEGDALFPLTYEISSVQLYQIPGYGEFYQKAPGGGKAVTGKDPYAPHKPKETP